MYKCQYCQKDVTEGAFSHISNCNLNNPSKASINRAVQRFTKRMEEIMFGETPEEKEARLNKTKNFKKVKKYLGISDD